MIAWWQGLSERERLIVGVGGAVAALLFVFQFMVKPVANWHAGMSSRADVASQEYALVTSAAAAGARVAAPSDSANTNVPLRQALTLSAAAAQIDLVRVGAEVDGQIEAQPSAVEPERLFQWIAALDSRYGISVAFADIARVEDGEVNAQVLVFERDN